MIHTTRRFLELMSRSERIKACGLLLVLCINALLETLGLGVIYGFVSLIVEPELIHERAFISNALAAVGLTETKDILLAAGGALIVLTLVKNAFGMFCTYFQFSFSLSLFTAFSDRLMSRYLLRSYGQFLKADPSAMSRNLLDETNRLILSCFLPLVYIYTDLLLIVFACAFLLYENTLASLIIFGVLLLLYGGFLRLVRRWILRSGRRRLAANEQRYRCVSEAMDGIKTIKIFSTEGYFIRTFHGATANMARQLVRARTLSNVPRYLMDTVALAGLAIFIMFYLYQDRDMGSVIAFVTLYGAAAYRLLPSINRVSRSLNDMAFYRKTLDLIHGELRQDIRVREVASTEPIPFTREITLNNVRFRHAQRDQDALSGINLSLGRSQTLGVVGPTGSGKTTLVDLMTGLLEPTQGEISIDGNVLTSTDLDRWMHNIAYVPQDIFVLDDTVARNIAIGFREDEIDMDAVQEAARQANLAHHIETGMPEGYQSSLGSRGVRLSGGQRQRLGIARALYHKRPVLVLDEATSALDSVTEAEIQETIRSLHGMVTIIIIAHRLSTVRDCDKIVLMNEGRLVSCGSYDELAADSDLFRSMLTAQGLSA